MRIDETLLRTGLPVAYSTFKEPVEVPFLCYIGGGQDRFFAENTIYKKTPVWQVEYYFKLKNPETEEMIESILLENGWIYDKGDDVVTEDEDMTVIFYNVWRK